MGGLLRSQQLINGFKSELDGRLKGIQDARGKLEALFSNRVDDAVVDEPQHAAYKGECMIALRNAESAFTSYAGSVRSIKAVVETLLYLQHCYLYMVAGLYNH